MTSNLISVRQGGASERGVRGGVTSHNGHKQQLPTYSFKMPSNLIFTIKLRAKDCYTLNELSVSKLISYQPYYLLKTEEKIFCSPNFSLKLPGLEQGVFIVSVTCLDRLGFS